MKRSIIEIDNEKCNGCGQCIPNCPEGALQIIDEKARLVSDLFCDGLGACIGHCPEGAITVIEREAEPYNEEKVMENIVKHGENTIKAHLEHLRDHNEEKYLAQAVAFLEEKGIENPLKEKAETSPLPCGCPGSNAVDFRNEKRSKPSGATAKQESELRQWPVQLMLVSPNAPYFDDADLLIAADCVAFSLGGFHGELLRGKSLVIGCPKLDDVEYYKEKLTEIIKQNNVKSITVAIMEVPCCYGLYAAVEEAVESSGKDIEVIQKTVSIKGEVM
ncbi:MAG: 4Fe-4S binding protein [archaeon]|jgi:ferredoxin|nr:4Fe-4S binding protein [archaeon]